MIVLKWLGIGIAVIVVGVAALFAGARFHDVPIAMIPGGAFSSGTWFDAPVTEWAFVADLETIEMQLAGAVIREKYSPPPGGAHDVWFFEVGSRTR